MLEDKTAKILLQKHTTPQLESDRKQKGLNGEITGLLLFDVDQLAGGWGQFSD
jgi:hypothetical protein